jgi:hypothetical protein
MAPLADSADVQERATYLGILAAVRRAESRHAEVLEAGEEALAAAARLGAGVSVDEKVALGEVLESALVLGRLEVVEELVQRIESIPPGIRPPFLVALAARFRSHLRARRGEVGAVEQGFKTAAAVLREHGLVFNLAVVLLEHGEWLLAQGDAAAAEPLIGEAREIFDRLEATPWSSRCDTAWSDAAATA